METLLASMREQLAQSEARHEEQLAQSLAQSEARYQEQLTQSLAQSNVRHQEQMREMMLHMREMFAQFSPHMHSSQLSQVPKKFNLTKLNLLQCIVM